MFNIIKNAIKTSNGVNRKLIASIAVLGLMISLTPVLAQPGRVSSEVQNHDGATAATVFIPPFAGALSPAIVSIGTSVDTDGTVLEGYAIIHYKPMFGHKPNHNPGGGGGGGRPDGGGDKCYAPLAKNVKWKSAENYMVDGTNSHGISVSTVETIVTNGVEKWDSKTPANIFGSRVANNVQHATIGSSSNGQNEVVFGEILGDSAIAVTYVWAIWGGPPPGREIREWDMIYDDSSFTWDTDGNANDMDFDNIFTHEAGHAVGLGHPSDTCTDETMFRFAGEGETKKRSLNQGDIAGVVNLYK